MPAPTLARIVDLPPQVLTLEGPARAGRARLQGGYLLDWSLRWPTGFGLAAEIVVTGADTRLNGLAVLEPGAIGLRDLTGTAGSGLLRLAPGLGLDCDSRATVRVAHATWSRVSVRAAGDVQIAEGTCRAGSRAVPLPAAEVVLSEDGDAGLAVASSLSGPVLGSLRITPGRRAVVTIEPQGAALATGTAPATALVLDLPF